MGVPIDVNTTRKTRSLPLQECYYCGDANYLVCNCPYQLDIRQLIAEQRKELIKDIMAMRDAALVEESYPLKEEDFV